MRFDGHSCHSYRPTLDASTAVSATDGKLASIAKPRRVQSEVNSHSCIVPFVGRSSLLVAPNRQVWGTVGYSKNGGSSANFKFFNATIGRNVMSWKRKETNTDDSRMCAVRDPARCLQSRPRVPVVYNRSECRRVLSHSDSLFRAF